jgi:hypothetical protein
VLSVGQLSRSILELLVKSSPGAAGLSGGGTMYAPAVNTMDPRVMVVSCDMGGLYLSEDTGATWRMLVGW